MADTEFDLTELMEADLNKLAAKQLKLEMAGKSEAAAKIGRKIDAAREVQRAPAAGAGAFRREGGEHEGDQVRVLSKLDLAEASRSVGSSSSGISGTKKRKGGEYDDKGNRVSYYKNDSASLAELVKREHEQNSSYYNENFARSIMKSKHYKQKSTDEQFDEAEQSLDRYERGGAKRSRKTNHEIDRIRQRAAQMFEKKERTLAECRFCLSSPKRNKLLTLSLGLKVYLSLPPEGPLVDGHCILTTMEHETSSLTVDEDTYEEIRYFEKYLRRMFRSMKRGVLFMETVMDPSRDRHMRIDCVPLPHSAFSDAPITFSQELSTADEMWSQHKKVIDTRKHGLRRSIPKQFAFFHVDFDGEGGYAHVIEDTNAFPRDFGMSCAAGLLRLDPTRLRHPPRLSASQIGDIRKEFLEKWKTHDWTVKLSGGKYDGSSSARPSQNDSETVANKESDQAV